MDVTIEAGHGPVHITLDEKSLRIDASGMRLEAAWPDIVGAGLARQPGGGVTLDAELEATVPLLRRLRETADEVVETHRILLIVHGPRHDFYQVGLPIGDPATTSIVDELRARLGPRWIDGEHDLGQLKKRLGARTPAWYWLVGIMFVVGIVVMVPFVLLAAATIRDAIEDLDPSSVELWMPTCPGALDRARRRPAVARPPPLALTGRQRPRRRDDRAVTSLLDPTADQVAMLGYLRDHDPVHWSAELNMWVLTRHHDISTALRDPRFGRGYPEGTAPERDWSLDIPAIRSMMDHLFLAMDPPDHTRLRGSSTGRSRRRPSPRSSHGSRRSWTSCWRRSTGETPSTSSPTSPSRCRPPSSPSCSACRRRTTPGSSAWSDDFAVVIDIALDADWPRSRGVHARVRRLHPRPRGRASCRTRATTCSARSSPPAGWRRADRGGARLDGHPALRRRPRDHHQPHRQRHPRAPPAARRAGPAAGRSGARLRPPSRRCCGSTPPVSATARVAATTSSSAAGRSRRRRRSARPDRRGQPRPGRFPEPDRFDLGPTPDRISPSGSARTSARRAARPARRTNRDRAPASGSSEAAARGIPDSAPVWRPSFVFHALEALPLAG